MPQIAVVIPARNEAANIAACVTSIRTASSAAQLTAPDILVVDDASTDRTCELAEQAGARVLRQQRQSGPLRAWDRGVRDTNAPFIIFVDADCVIASDALSHILHSFADDNVGVVAARAVPQLPHKGKPSGLVERSACFSAIMLHTLKKHLYDHDALPIGRLMAVRRSAWNIEGTVGAPCDREVAHLTKSAGWHIVYEERAVVYYEPITRFQELRSDYLRTVLRMRLARAYDPIPGAVLVKIFFISLSLYPANAVAWIVCRFLLWSERITGRLGDERKVLLYWQRPVTN